MVFTAQLGTSDSMPGNIAFGMSGSEGENVLLRGSTAVVTDAALPSAVVTDAVLPSAEVE